MEEKIKSMKTMPGRMTGMKDDRVSSAGWSAYDFRYRVSGKPAVMIRDHSMDTADMDYINALNAICGYETGKKE